MLSSIKYFSSVTFYLFGWRIQKSKFVTNCIRIAAAETLEKEITQYLHRLSIQQKEVVLSVVKTFAGEGEMWTNKEYVTEMNRRFAELENGDVKGYSLDEMECGAREAYKMKKAGKR